MNELEKSPQKRNISSQEWTTQDTEELYGINSWGHSYFRVNKKGTIDVTPFGQKGSSVDLRELVEDLEDRGIRSPILIRFPDIVRARINLLKECFERAIKEYEYKGSYQGVYPVKVNQQKHLLKNIINQKNVARIGLECGSKPELLVALSLANDPDALIICNGFKDEKYIETTLLAKKLGHNIIVVIDRFIELRMIIEKAKEMGITPSIGFRFKLNAKGSGKWVDSSGARSKFGLTPKEVVSGIEILKENKMLEALELCHFHIGSQINAIQSIKSSLKEGTRIFTEVCKMGANIKYIDVGGGLGVDYDGTKGSDNSINYSEQEYANDVVFTIQVICTEKGVPHPTIITESGRSLVAHHSVLIFNALGKNEVSRFPHPELPEKSEHRIIRELYDISQNIVIENIHESYHDLIQLKNDILQLFSYGYFSLVQRAKAEELVWYGLTKMRDILQKNSEALDYSTEELLDHLEHELSDTIFCNFSVFQSMPDAWAVKQVFPIMPIQRLTEMPNHRAVLVDLTCDSDGRLDKFSQWGEITNNIAIHSFNREEPYYIGVFLLGAYQEALGDLHNLFGDTDAVVVEIHSSGYAIKYVEEGDTVAEVLSYVAYDRGSMIDHIRERIEQAIQKGILKKNEARLLLKNYEEGLAGYTYLEDQRK